MALFGLRLVKESFVRELESDLREYREYAARLERQGKEFLEISEKVKEKVSALEKAIEEKDAHILKMGKKLTKVDELYEESLRDKEMLKKAYMDIKRKLDATNMALGRIKKEYDKIKENEAQEPVDPNSLHQEIPDPAGDDRQEENKTLEATGQGDNDTAVVKDEDAGVEAPEGGMVSAEPAPEEAIDKPVESKKKKKARGKKK